MYQWIAGNKNKAENKCQPKESNGTVSSHQPSLVIGSPSDELDPIVTSFWSVAAWRRFHIWLSGARFQEIQRLMSAWDCVTA
jgi:hypothetical protein